MGALLSAEDESGETDDYDSDGIGDGAEALEDRCPISEQELVFPAVNGQPMRRSVALRRGLWPALRRAGLRKVNMHSSRHSFASALIANGSPVTEVQSILDHSSPVMTLNVIRTRFGLRGRRPLDTVVCGILSESREVAVDDVEKTGHCERSAAQGGAPRCRCRTR